MLTDYYSRIDDEAHALYNDVPAIICNVTPMLARGEMKPVDEKHECNATVGYTVLGMDITSGDSHV